MLGGCTLLLGAVAHPAAVVQDGHAHLYERFLNRMVEEGLTDTVLPVRTTSPVGARMMGILNYTVDAIYLDAAQVSLFLPAPEQPE